jgi:hypothetical protein
MVPEVSIAELDGGYLIHVAVEDGEEVVQHPAIRPTLEEAIDYIRDYFKDLDEAEEKLEKYVL